MDRTEKRMPSLKACVIHGITVDSDLVPWQSSNIFLCV